MAKLVQRGGQRQAPPTVLAVPLVTPGTPTLTTSGSGCPATQAMFLLPQENLHCRGMVKVLQERCILNAAHLLPKAKFTVLDLYYFFNFTFLDEN